MKKAFTLAEVLITLVIIGVIGALTVPALIQNTQKQEYVTALKKAYSTLAQAAQQIIAEEGSPKEDDGGWADSSEHVYTMFKKYLNSARDCNKGGACFSHNFVYNLDKTRNGYNPNEMPSLIIADGTIVSFPISSSKCKFTAGDNWAGSNNYCTSIIVDLNGDKAPNTMGKDKFQFVLKENGVFPAGCDQNYASSKGWDITCRVIKEGAINY